MENHTKALVLIDVQKAFDDPCWGKRNNPSAEEKIKTLLACWREQSLPVIHIKHNSNNKNSPLYPGQTGNDFKFIAAPLTGEPIFEKTVNSAFIGTELESHLHKNKIKELVVLGFTTDHCVSTTIRMAANLNFDVTLVADATVTFNRSDQNDNYYSAEDIHNVHLASLNGEFCDIKLMDTLLEEMKSES